jgi:hypothetical protein
MGVPTKVIVDGEPVFICCNACRAGLLEEPAMYLAKLRDFHANGEATGSSSSDDLTIPEIGAIVPLDDDGVAPVIAPIEWTEPERFEGLDFDLSSEEPDGRNDQ